MRRRIDMCVCVSVTDTRHLRLAISFDYLSYDSAESGLFRCEGEFLCWLRLLARGTRSVGLVRFGAAAWAIARRPRFPPDCRSVGARRRGWIGAPATTSPPRQPLCPPDTLAPSRHERLFLNLASQFTTAVCDNAGPTFPGVRFVFFVVGGWYARCMYVYRFGITRRLTSSFDDGVSARLSAALVGMGNSFAECAARALLLAWPRGVGLFPQSEIWLVSEDNFPAQSELAWISPLRRLRRREREWAGFWLIGLTEQMIVSTLSEPATKSILPRRQLKGNN